MAPYSCLLDHLLFHLCHCHAIGCTESLVAFPQPRGSCWLQLSRFPLIQSFVTRRKDQGYSSPAISFCSQISLLREEIGDCHPAKWPCHRPIYHLDIPLTSHGVVPNPSNLLPGTMDLGLWCGLPHSTLCLLLPCNITFSPILRAILFFRPVFLCLSDNSAIHICSLSIPPRPLSKPSDLLTL